MGCRLGATNPNRFKIDFFVNNLMDPSASVFASLGSMPYDHNGQIFLDTRGKKIPTDGLLLRGHYSAITLAIYGFLKEKENEMDTTNRYDNEFPDEDMFEQIVPNAEEAEREKERPKVTLTDEQKERMMRNPELAKQRQLEKKLEKQKLADEENTLGATTSKQNQIESPTLPHSTA